MRNFLLLTTLLLFVFTACKKEKSDSTAKQDAAALIDNAVNSFTSKYSIPGVAVAITKQGKLVYVNSYGTADVQANTPVTNNSLFRIAGLSQPLTSVAIMKLVEEGKLSLEAKVFGVGAILGTQYGTQPYSNGITAITVRHLLQHTAGGWPLNSDPLYTNPSMTATQLLSWTLDNRPLTYAPGTTYLHSSFGYFILGRVIEKVSGTTYQDYVKTAVLQPCGITGMQIGGNTEAECRPNEVKYYGQEGENPYSFNLARMDAADGWIATATDLARFSVHVDGFATKPDILSAASITTMTTPSAVYPNYAMGWNVNAQNTWWHSGSVPGTAARMGRTASGYTWVILCNSRRANNQFYDDLNNTMGTIINNNAAQWPDVDLF